jgi:hypothetical protein
VEFAECGEFPFSVQCLSCRSLEQC